MTRILEPLRRQSDGRWDMTVRSDDEGWTHAVGYCANWRVLDLAEATRLHGEDFAEILRRDAESKAPYRDRYHDGGHESADAALSCWRTYLLDLCLRFTREPDQLLRCRACGEWTDGRVELSGAEASGPLVALCPRHQDRENAGRFLFPADPSRCPGIAR